MTPPRTSWFAAAWTVLRLATAATILAAIVAQFVASVSNAAALGRDVTTTVVNFFSFFTILSNLSAAIVLLWAVGWFVARGRRDAAPEPRSLAVALASVSTYMIVTGIVYNVLLRGVQLEEGSRPIPWSNEVLHLVAPVLLLLDVLLGPARRRLRWSGILAVVVFPLVWVVYTLVRAPLTTNPITGDPWWYPYPFLNPHLQAWGYGGVTLYVVGIAIVIAGVAWFVVWVGRRRGAPTAA